MCDYPEKEHNSAVVRRDSFVFFLFRLENDFFTNYGRIHVVEWTNTHLLSITIDTSIAEIPPFQIVFASLNENIHNERKFIDCCYRFRLFTFR